MITVTQLSKRFGAFTAVDDLSFSVEARQAVALWGPNGAGKTTVIKCLLGLLRYQGRIEVRGFDVANQGKLVRGLLGYVPQELSFYDDMGALEMARYFARLKKAPSARAEAVIAEVGLAGHEGKRVGTLSGGMKQRLALGLALLADPPLLVLDEPTSNLDAGAREQFLRLLASVKQEGRTVIFTSHRLEEVEALADEVLVLDGGRLQSRCRASDLPHFLGLRATVKLRMPAHLLDPALAILHAQGLTARRNGTGLLVEVMPGAKARPIQLLHQADIAVEDFELM